jgi:hypothetical protein
MTMPKNLLDLFTTNGRQVPFEPLQRFLAAHTIDSFPDRNGNGDDVFKATNVEFYNRQINSQGYNPPQDKEVYMKNNEDHVEALRKAHIAVAQRWMVAGQNGDAIDRLNPVIGQVAAKY